MPAAETNQQSGTSVVPSTKAAGSVLSFAKGAWAMYGSIDLGSGSVRAKAIELVASAAGSGGTVEVWLDPRARSGRRVATCPVASTGDWETWQIVTCGLRAAGTHEVHLKVTDGAGEVVRISSLRFVPHP
jgi:hypothetical protein